MTLANKVSAISEAADVSSHRRVADISVADDGLGTNVLSLGGPDAASFELVGSSLYLRAGVTLSHAAHPVLAVTVAVDDPSTGGSPDASIGFTLNVTQAVPAGAIVISEVAPWSSSSTLGADWFEVTNAGSVTIDLAGWKMDDNSHSFANAVALNGIDAIGPGEAVIFVETSDLATVSAAFRSLWFGPGAVRVPRFGSYSGSGVGLSSGGDEVTLFDAAGNLVTGVGFGASPSASPLATFDNHAGVGAQTLPLPVLATLSAIDVNGAFAAAIEAGQVGSPGIGNVGRIIVSEVAPWASGDSPYGADWFEVTNVGSAAVDMTGWTMDDDSNNVAQSVAINGASSLAPGQSVILIEGDATVASAFVATWFGTHPPTGFRIGTYSGSKVGLSTGGDAVNLFNASGNRVTGVTFGAATTGFTFDNTAGLGMVATLSAVGVNGAFVATDGAETGSPGATAYTIAYDYDHDGILNGVDPLPFDPANQTFSDVAAPYDGATSGVILDRGGKDVTIADRAPNPANGVQVDVGGAGAGPVSVRLDGKAATIDLPNGTYVLTDPALTSTVSVVSGGPAVVHLVLNGLPVELRVGAGGSVTYTETLDDSGELVGLSIDAVSGSVAFNCTPLKGPLTLVGPPRDKNACKGRGWQTFNFPRAFKNQGDCVSYVATGGK